MTIARRFVLTNASHAKKQKLKWSLDVAWEAVVQQDGVEALNNDWYTLKKKASRAPDCLLRQMRSFGPAPNERNATDYSFRGPSVAAAIDGNKRPVFVCIPESSGWISMGRPNSCCRWLRCRCCRQPKISH